MFMAIVMVFSMLPMNVFAAEADHSGHTITISTTAATCTADGSTTYTCETCGGVVISTEVIRAGHTPGAEATCGTAQTCTVCGTELAPATGNHTPGAEATCGTAQTCTVCGAELAPATEEHIFADAQGNALAQCACGKANPNYKAPEQTPTPEETPAPEEEGNPDDQVAPEDQTSLTSENEDTSTELEVTYAAKIGEQGYETLKAAFDAVQSGQTIVLQKDLKVDTETYTIADGKSVTLDMNGKKLTVTDNKTSNYELFYIYGEMTVTGNGTIELTSATDREWNAMSAIFHNRGGVLTIENGTYKNLGGTDMAWVVDNSGNWYGDATTNIKGGTLNSTYTAIRNRMEENSHGASGKATLNISGGKISGTTSAVWAQAASTSTTAPATGAINVSGGEVGLINTARAEGAVSMTTITDGTVEAFKGEIGELTVKGGTLSSVTLMDADGKEVNFIVNADGLYVKAAPVMIGEQGYETLQDAVNAASTTGETVITLNAETISGDVNITLNAVGEQKGNIKIVAASGVTPVITGKVTLGYYERCVGNKDWKAAVSFEGVTFDHAEAATHSIDVQSVQGFSLVDCTIIGDGEYGIGSSAGNNTTNSSITNCTFTNAGMQVLGNFGTGLVIDGCTFINSCINVQGGNLVTIQDSTFNTALNTTGNFYVIRSNDNAIVVKDCEINVDSKLYADAAPDTGKAWAIFWQRNVGNTKWSMTDIKVNYTDAALAQTELLLNKNATTTEANQAGRVVISGLTGTEGLLAKTEGYVKVQEGTKTVVYKDGVVQSTTDKAVAYIGEQGYETLAAAIAAVADGGTITLVNNITFTEETRTLNSDTWYDGLYYIGDKSFTIDLGGFTIGHDGSVNDYLLNFKNEGAKANTITIKNGTVDAGTSAFCAICTSSTSTKQITINLENVNLINNNSNGAVAKIRGGAVLNVKAGTVITGKNSYVGIEAVGTTTVVNIFEGAKIYQQGTDSYVGSLAGVSNGATLNVYGGSGTSAQGGFIAMTSGGTINVSGGEWIANTDGTYANDNKSVLIAQSEEGAKCVINVTGGTFKGGYNCYGAAVGDAQLNIKGGTFNADPSAYLAKGYAITGTYTVAKAVAKVGDNYYATLQDAFKAATEGCTIEILSDVTVDGKWDCRDNATGGSHSQFKEAVTIKGNGHTIKFTGTVNDNNWNTIFRFEENATVQNLTIDISEATGAQRVITAKKSLTVDGLTIFGSAKYGVIFGEGSSAADLAAAEIVIKNSTLTGTRRAISDNEGGKDVKSVVITDNILNANVYVSASEGITFNNNTASGEVDLRSYAADNVLAVEANGNTLNAAVKNYIYAKTIDAQEGFNADHPPFKVSTKAELNAALSAAQEGDTILLTADIDYGTEQLAITKAITLDLGGKTLTTRNAYGGMSVKGNPTIKNGTIVHASNTSAIKVWNATAFEDLVIDVQGKGDANKTIGGIVLQSGSTTRVGSIKNVTIKGAALTNGIETYNCGDATENVIGSMENVNIDAQGTGMLISAPCGTATNCSVSGGKNGIEIWIKGTYSASLDLVNSKVEGGVHAHDEFSSNPSVVNNGTLSLTVDEATTGVSKDDITLTIARANEDKVEGILETIITNAKAKVNDTYYETLDAAMTAAKAGDTVKIFAGTYTMPSMKAGITLEGIGNVQLNGTLSGTLENLTLRNLHIKGGNAQRWAYAKGNLHFENVTFEATSVYALHFDGIAKGTNLMYKDCTIIGWAAMGGSPESCVFDGCTIKGNGTYGVIRTYFDATIENCTFDVANVNPNDVYQDGIHAVDGAKVTVNDCTNKNGSMADIVNVSGSSVVVVDDVAIQNVAKIGSTSYTNLDEAFASVKNGDTVTMMANGTLTKEVILDGMTLTVDGSGTLNLNKNLKVKGETTLNITAPLDGEVWLDDGAIIVNSIIKGDVFVGGNVTFRGANSVNMLYDYGTLTDYYGTVAPMQWTVEEGASLTVNNKARYGLGYGDKVTIIGNLTDAKRSVEPSLFMHGLVAQESKGWNCDSSFTVKNAYVVIGQNNSFGNKPGNYGGSYTFTFENARLDASRITFYEALSTTDFSFINSDVKTGTFMTNDTDSVFTLTNTKLLSTTTTNGNDEGNYNAGVLKLTNSELTYSAPVTNKGSIEMDASSVLTAPAITGAGKIVIDATGYTGGAKTVVAADMSGFTGTIEIKGATYEVTADGIVVNQAVAMIGEQCFASLDAAFAAAKADDEVKINKAGTYKVPTGKNITITGAVDGVVFDNIGAHNMAGASVTFNNVTFDYYPNVDYTGLQHSGNLVYNNCTFNGQVFLYGQSETFKNCTFNQNSAGAYNVWTYGAKEVKFNECTFNSAGKSVLIYKEKDPNFNANVSVEGSTFNASAAVDGKAAIEMDSSLIGGINLTIDGATTATGFGSGNVSGNSLWNNKKGSNTDANNDITVVVNGETVLAPVTFVAKIGEIGYADLHEAMVAAKAGETVKLVVDVDLAGTTWEPVSFMGTFDGQNLTISNLTINKPGVSNTGFITSLNGTFQNVTFVNPTVTGGENTGVVAGRAGGGYALAKNITVTGTIKVETTHSGYARAGVIVGGWAYGKYENITVDGVNAAQSYIKHTGGGDGRYVGGIVGHADDVAAYTNCTVKNITISGGWLCGAIAGPGPASTVTSGCKVENVTMDADYSGGMFGWYFGNGTIKDSSIKNVTFTAGSSNNGAIGGYGDNSNAVIENVTIENVQNDDGAPLLEHVATVDGVHYFSLADAIAAANGKTVTVLKDITLTETVTIPAGKTITLDLNGKTISQTKAQTAGYQMILNDGYLTIMDSFGGGKISYTDSGNGGEYISDTIYNRGTLVINGGTIENLSSATVATNGYPHAVDTYSGIRDTSVTINGGTIYCAEYSAIRMFCVSATYKADLVINRGTIKGAVDMQNGTKDAALGSLTITGGTFETTKNANNIRFANWNGGATEYGITASIKGGSFDGNFTTKYVPAAANWNSQIIFGGTYTVAPAKGLIAAGFAISYDAENEQFVVIRKAVATVNGEDFTTLQDAVNAAKPGDTVFLKSDVVVPEDVTVPADANITLQLKGYIFNGSIIAPNAELSILNGSIVNKNSSVSAIEINAGKLTLTNVNVNSARHAVRIDGAVEATINSGNYKAAIGTGKGTYHALNISGAANVTIKDGTFVGPKGTTADSGSAVNVQSGAKVVIEKGTFSGGKNSTLASAGTLTVTGGTFDQDPSKYVPETHKVVKNPEGQYVVSEKIPVAKIGEKTYESLAEALTAAKDGETITLIWAEGDAPIAMNGYVSGKTVTITGKAAVDWEKGFLFVGRTNDGTAAANATLIFEDAELTTTQGGDHGIHVSGAEKDSATKANGTVKFINSTVNLSYLINKGDMVLDNSTLTVKSGFSIGGRPAKETASGEDATATLNLTNNSKVVVNNHNGMGLGYEAIGVMNIDATSTFETTQSFLVTAKGTMNIAGTAKIAGTLTNNGKIVLTDAAATLTANESGNVTAEVKDHKITYADGAYKVVAKDYVAQVGEKKFESLQEAINAAQNGQTITLLADVTEDVTVSKNLTIDGGDFKYTGTMTVSNGKTVTIENVNFVKGSITKAKGTSGNLTVKNCDFDGVDNTIAYAVTMRGGNSVTMEGCTSKNYDYGMLYVPSAVTNVTVKDTIADGGSYGVHVAYGTNVTLDTVKMNDVANGIMTQNYGAKTITIKNCELTGTNPIYVWERNTTVVDTFKFEGTNTVSALPASAQAKLVLAASDAVLTAPAGATVTTTAAGYEVEYHTDKYVAVPIVRVAKISETGTEYKTLAAAIDAATAGQTITLIADISEDVTVNKSLTIDGANFKYTGNISVSGTSTEATIKNVNFVNGTGYAVTTNRIKSITVENCTVKNYGAGFLYANKSTPTVVVKNVTVDGGEYGMHWVYGTTATLENVTMTNVIYGLRIQNYAGKTINLKNCDITSIAIWERDNVSGIQTFKFEGKNTVGALTNSQYAKYVLAAADATLTAPADFRVTTNVQESKVVYDYEDDTYKVIPMDFVAETGGKKYETLADAFNYAEAGATVTLLKDFTMDGSIAQQEMTYGYDVLVELTAKAVTLDLAGHIVRVTPSCESKGGNQNTLEAVIFLGNGANLTVTDSVGNGGFRAYKGDTLLYCLIYNSKSTLTIKKGNFAVEELPQSGSLIYADKQNNTTIEGGVFSLINVGTYDNTKPWVFNVHGKNEGNFVNINGGYFYKQNPYLNFGTGNDCEVNIPDDMFFEQITSGDYAGYWKLVPAAAMIGETGYRTLQEAIDAADDGDTIELLKEAGIGLAQKSLVIKRNGFSATIAALSGYTVLTDGNAYIVKTMDDVLVDATGAKLAYIDTDAAGYNGEELMSLSMALSKAKSGDTVKLTADLTGENKAGTVIIPSGVTLDIESHTLAAEYIIGLNGSTLTGKFVNSKGIHGKVIVAKDNIALSRTPYHNGTAYVLPMWMGEAYGFAQISPYMTSAPFTVTDKSIKFAFSLYTTNTIKGYLAQNGGDYHGMSMIVTLSWNVYDDNGEFMSVASQSFEYTEDHIKTVAAATNQYFNITITNYEGLKVDMDSLKAVAEIVTDTGAVSYSDAIDYN